MTAIAKSLALSTVAALGAVALTAVAPLPPTLHAQPPADNVPPRRDPTRAADDWNFSSNAPTPVVLPRVALKGRVLVADRPAAALLELDSARLLVRVGSSLPLPLGADNVPRVLHVESIDADAVRLRIDPPGQILTLR